MIPMTLAEIATATGGRLDAADPDATVTGTVEHDSRRVTAGGLFVALRGERVDGHDFADRAVADGAAAVLASRPVGVPAVVVADPLTALGQLARALVDRLPGLVVVGVTGSSGKTTVKDLIAQLTTRLGPTVAPHGTLNNELGHPYTVLRADTTTRYLVVEKSSRGLGHIRYLCEVAPPHVGVVLNVGPAHVGEFGSVDAIAKAKAELVEALPPGGLAVLNADDPRVRAMAGRTAARVALVGRAADAQIRADEVRLDDRGRPSMRLVTPAGAARVRLALHGTHQVDNVLAAAAVALELGMPFDTLVGAVADLRAVSTRRMDVFERNDGVTVIDDSYNANPGSMAAALHTLAAVGAGRRTWAVLGYMAELGAHERDAHEEVGRLAAELGVDRVVAVGEGAEPIGYGAAADRAWEGAAVQVADQPAAIALLAEELGLGDVVLVKGSRYRTWDVVDALREGAVACPQ